MLDTCLCQQVLSYCTSETSENLGETVEEGDLFLLHADTQKLTEGTDEGVNAPVLILDLDMSKVISRNWKTAELEEIATESQQG